MQILHRTPDGGRPATFYNLDLIISVGYLVKSKRGTQFRIWATSVLRDHTYAALDHRTVSPPRKPAARASRPKPEAAETGWGGASV